MDSFKLIFAAFFITITASFAFAQSGSSPKTISTAPVKCGLKSYDITSQEWTIDIDDASVLGGKPVSFSLTYKVKRGVDGDGREVPQTKAVARLLEAYSGPRNNVYAFDAYVFSMNPETGEATVYAPWYNNYTLTCTAHPTAAAQKQQK